MKRQIYSQLTAWKNREDRKPLVILGARQVGKTWIMRHFGEREYERVHETCIRVGATFIIRAESPKAQARGNALGL